MITVDSFDFYCDRTKQILALLMKGCKLKSFETLNLFLLTTTRSLNLFVVFGTQSWLSASQQLKCSS